MATATAIGVLPIAMLRLVLWLLGGAVCCIGYGFIEARLPRVRTHTLPVLPQSHPGIRILQISDTHLRKSNRRLRRFLDSLANEEYDFVLATGDLLGEPAALEDCTRLLNALKGRSGRFFVFGSSDYYAPGFKSYLDYFRKRRRHSTRRNPTEEFRSSLVDDGWTDLSNQTKSLTIDGFSWQITGLDDPYLKRDDKSLLVRTPEARFALCVVHDPAPHEIAAEAGFDLIVSGHTHGGQVRFPLIGAVVTNSTTPTSRARWTTKLNGSYLFVSPGLGTGKFAPFRFMCRPEASVLELVARTRNG